MPAKPASGEEELGVDESLSEVEKLEKYVKGPVPLQRLVYVKRVMDTCLTLDEATIDARVCPLLHHAAKDSEAPIRQALAPELANLAAILRIRNMLTLVRDHCLPILLLLLQDAAQEVRDAAATSLPNITGILNNDLQINHVVAPLKALLQDSTDDDQTTTCIAVLMALAKPLGADAAREHLVSQLVSSSTDASFRIRKACAQKYGLLCHTVGPAVSVELLLPAFDKLSTDSIWSVRKGCVESLVNVASAVTKQERANTFIPMIHRFVKDVSRWVRNAAYKTLGPLLFALEVELITPELLALYTGIPELSTSLVDVDVNFFCAFTFPAVATRLGADRWPELNSTFATLCKDTKFKVRRTLSHSLHELALLLGPDATQQYLLEPFTHFLKDLDEVRIGVVSHLATFFDVLSEEAKLEHIDVIREVQNEPDTNWRFRRVLAAQLDELAMVFPVDTVATQIVPVLLSLCRDRISAVRSEAVARVGNFLLVLDDHPSYPELVQEIHAFAHSPSFLDRELYIRICTGLIQDIPLVLIERDFLQLLCKTACDPVINVRLVLAQALLNSCSDAAFSRHSLVTAAAFLLSKDTSRDVVDIVQELPERIRQPDPAWTVETAKQHVQGSASE